MTSHVVYNYIFYILSFVRKYARKNKLYGDQRNKQNRASIISKVYTKEKTKKKICIMLYVFVSN